MNALFDTFQTLPTYLQVFWVCAGISSLIFIIQFVLTMIGLDHSDVDVDFDGSDTLDLGDGVNIFTMKNFINFMMGFGWAGVCLHDSIENPIILTLVAVIVGASFVIMFLYIYAKTRKLEKNGAVNVNDSLGQTAQVYIRIPAGGEGKGKVQISLNGSIHEFDAITEEDTISSGTTVKIIEVLPGGIVKVENIQNNLVI